MNDQSKNSVNNPENQTSPQTGTNDNSPATVSQAENQKPEVEATTSTTDVQNNNVVEVENNTIASPINTTENNSLDNTQPETVSSTGAGINSRRMILIHYGIAGLIILIMSGGLWFMLEKQGRVNSTVFASFERMIFGEPAAVIVSGEKVPLSLYEKNVTQLSAMAREQGLDPLEPQVADEIKQQTIDLLINTEILRQAAVKAGVNVSEEEISTRYQSIVEQLGSEAELEKRLVEIGNTIESLQTDIAAEILIQKHLDTAVDKTTITVTDEEVKKQYDDMVSYYKSQGDASQVDIPEFSEAKNQVSERIRFEKEQTLITEYIENLKKEATIDVRI